MSPGGVCGTSVSTIVDYASPYLPFVFSVFTAPRNFTVHFFQLTFVFFSTNDWLEKDHQRETVAKSCREDCLPLVFMAIVNIQRFI